MTLLHLVILSCISISINALSATTDLTVANLAIAPDGFNRSAVLAGAAASSVSFPGPVITANKGDAFGVNVINSLTDTSMLISTSIHWHGITQAGTNWADGPVGVSQCPIAQNNSFLYTFNPGDQAGTFWYHSHHSTQYCDGLRGALIVYDPNDPNKSLYDVDDETTIISLADWYHIVAPKEGLVPTPDSTLFNGLGRYAGGTSSPLAVISVEAGKKYRFRLIAMSCDPNWVFSIDGHTMTIIEVEGVNTQSLVVDSIQIYAGQRYSFVLNANQAVDNYWIRADPSTGTTGFDGGINSAILRYSGANSTTEPTTTSSLSQPLVETNLHPLDTLTVPGTAVPGGADVDLAIQLALNSDGTAFTVNNVTFTPPTVPVLLQIMSGSSTAQDLLPAGSVYTLPANATVELNIPGGAAGGPHPMHLHGHKFAVVQSAGNSTNNYVNPIWRDVVNVGSSTSDNVTIRFKTDNPGPWILHCHIDWHLEHGMAIVFAEEVDQVNSTVIPTDQWKQLCPTYDALPAQTFT